MNIGIVLNYKNYSQSIDCTNNLLNSDMDKVVIVDNASGNESYQKLKEYFRNNKKVHIISSDVNSGYAQGNNIGLIYVQNRFGISSKNIVYIINPDSRIDSSNVDDIRKHIINNENSGMVTVNLNNDIKNSWHHLSVKNIFFINFWSIRWLLFKFGKREGGYYKKGNTAIQKVDVVSGAFFGINQKVFKEIGYFDKGTFLYYEEEILYSKLIQNGFQNYILNTSSFDHIGRGSTSFKKVPFKKINDKSRLYVLKKYYGVGPLYVSFSKFINVIDDFLLTVLKR
ncbi:glycosyltransferase [Companilactobacillus kimchiensis]|uniref:Glycosyl transferase n=1 Tax=Companilactobacillus kimchiensis TaxID=993692 RepID=A0A0R2LF23_9LACO|nr:glycosyltransferase [Companilactobacillus kimchiensis]KRO00388.1 glycosyl transferase [Companilactobacillus kimchiensis]